MARQRHLARYTRQEGPIRKFFHDFGNLYRFRDANAALRPPVPGERRVVFFGDSITDFWNLDDSFPGMGYINRGIGGQTTAQLLLRFRPDVVDLQPALVMILAGTNDLAGNTGPATIDEIAGNLASMADLARAHGILPIFGSVTPVHRASPAALNFSVLRPLDRILALNDRLKHYCASEGLAYIDYFSAMADEHGMMRTELADDGLHPNAAGYALMTPLAQAVITAALGQSADAQR